MNKKIGMLWFDNSKSSPESKIVDAAKYYASKYGKSVTWCQVNPTSVVGDVVSGIKVTKNQYIMPNHYWVGVDL